MVVQTTLHDPCIVGIYFSIYFGELIYFNLYAWSLLGVPWFRPTAIRFCRRPCFRCHDNAAVWTCHVGHAVKVQNKTQRTNSSKGVPIGGYGCPSPHLWTKKQFLCNHWEFEDCLRCLRCLCVTQTLAYIETCSTTPM